MITIERFRIWGKSEQYLGDNTHKILTAKDINGDFLPYIKELKPLIDTRHS
jgi:hypothetical protein